LWKRIDFDFDLRKEREKERERKIIAVWPRLVDKVNDAVQVRRYVRHLIKKWIWIFPIFCSRFDYIWPRLTQIHLDLTLCAWYVKVVATVGRRNEFVSLIETWNKTWFILEMWAMKANSCAGAAVQGRVVRSDSAAYFWHWSLREKGSVDVRTVAWSQGLRLVQDHPIDRFWLSNRSALAQTNRRCWKVKGNWSVDGEGQSAVWSKKKGRVKESKKRKRGGRGCPGTSQMLPGVANRRAESALNRLWTVQTWQ
jgi:hypothetical protein